MWGSWLGVTFAGLIVVLFLIAISLLASPVLAVLIVGGIAVLAAVVVVGRRATEAGRAEAESKNPHTAGAPASGEGSGAPTSSTGPAS